MVRDNRHDTAYLFGAICPARGVGAAVITPAANTECMNLHLKEISTQVTPGACAALVCDGAGWHQRGGELELPDNIIMVTLPPYSPELNPMENVSARSKSAPRRDQRICYDLFIRLLIRKFGFLAVWRG
jgi:hypothetical protein